MRKERNEYRRRLYVMRNQKIPKKVHIVHTNTVGICKFGIVQQRRINPLGDTCFQTILPSIYGKDNVWAV